MCEVHIPLVGLVRECDWEYFHLVPWLPHRVSRETFANLGVHVIAALSDVYCIKGVYVEVYREDWGNFESI